MAALVQGYPHQSGTVTMLQARPSSSSAMLPTVPAQSSAQYMQGGSQRNSIHGLPAGAAAPVVYRGGSTPVQPYAFTSTPSLNPTTQWQKVRSHRTSSSPAIPTIQTLDYLQPAVARPRYTASASMTNLPSTGAISLTGAGARDDSAAQLSGTQRAAATARQQQASQMNGGSSLPPTASTAQPRVAPERYRRTALRGPDSGHQPQGAASGQETVAGGKPGNSRNGQDQKSTMLHSPQALQTNRPNSFVGPTSGTAVDDMGHGQAPGEFKRIRRRSMPALDSAGFSTPLTPPELKQPGEPKRLERSAVAKNAAKENKNVKTGNNNLAVDKKTTGVDSRATSSDSRSSGRSSVASSASRASSVSTCPCIDQSHVMPAQPA